MNRFEFKNFIEDSIHKIHESFLQFIFYFIIISSCSFQTQFFIEKLGTYSDRIL